MIAAQWVFSYDAAVGNYLLAAERRVDIVGGIHPNEKLMQVETGCP